ncbi:hypothetical protein [Bosea sp. BK604]|uniref:hypothetical protein n=1 Tax=Bosea sp. BK604 TaxID=2512180 RepID=UPI001047791D|nr:hypothetical protein [Bosea sp. BK604]TCR64686.1 hypothetical protein EV560_106152 [Bosea sp. BK604]
MGMSQSGTSQRRQAMATQIEQQAELDKQKSLADAQQASAMQDGLARDTNRLLRVFGAKSMLAGGGVRMPVAVR